MLPVHPAQSAENGLGVYPLGYNSSMAGFLPSPGLYVRNDFYSYQGTASKITLSGRVEADLRGRYLIDMVNLTHVTPDKILGANYAAAVICGVVANTFIKGHVEVGNLLTQSRKGDRTSVSDMTLMPPSWAGMWGSFTSWPWAMFMCP